jgi:hypothetical protein
MVLQKDEYGLSKPCLTIFDVVTGKTSKLALQRGRKSKKGKLSTKALASPQMEKMNA